MPVLGPGARGEAVAVLQVALSNREFSPGAVDGRFGPLLIRALTDYQRSRGLEPDGVAGAAVWRDLGISSGEVLFRSHEVTPEDTAGLGWLPPTWEERSDLTILPYQTVAERLAERYQTSAAYLVSLTPGARWPNPAPGTELRVPAVAFETRVEVALPYRRPWPHGPGAVDPLADLPAGLDSAAAAESVAVTRERRRVADSVGVAIADSLRARLRSRWERRARPGVEVRVSSRERAVRVYRWGRLVSRYPATVGSREFPNPTGVWRIVSQVFAPDYRYDEEFLRTGRRSGAGIRIPPGPNNIVGMMWLGLNKAGYGLHGTDEPETIGAAASHGCVRLANWDVERLGLHVGIGTPVTIVR